MTIQRNVTGKFRAQTSDGSLITSMALTKQSSYSYEGRTRTNCVYLAVGRGKWNKRSGYAAITNGTGNAFVRVTGVVSGCEVTGDGSNDNVQVAAGVANVNGTRVVVGADTSNAITRGAAAHYAVHAVHVNASGTIAVTAGTDGDSLDLTGGYGGAGQKPLVAVTECVLAYVVTYGNTAAAIPSTDIYAGDSANVSYKIDPALGGIVLDEALPSNQAGPLPRTIYAAFYDLTNAMAPLGYLEDATLTIKGSAPQATPSHDSVWDQYVPLPNRGWGVDVKEWRPDDTWEEKLLDPFADEFLLELTEDIDDTKKWTGYGILSPDGSVTTKRGARSRTLKFTGNGALIHA